MSEKEQKEQKYFLVSQVRKIVNQRYVKPFDLFVKMNERFGIDKRSFYRYYNSDDVVPKAAFIEAMKTLHPELKDGDFFSLLNKDEYEQYKENLRD